ncbi:MAG: hypothetical protein WCG19_09665 [Chlorobiaceae bacterium]
MKKTAKILSLAVALFAGVSGTAQAADGFKIGADLVTSYVWRGTAIGDSPAIQPALSYTFKDSNIVVGAWGSYAVIANTPLLDSPDYRYQETDFYVTLPIGPFSLTATDYFMPFPGSSDAFSFKNGGPNIAEVSLGYAQGDLSLLAAINFAGTHYDYAKYFEAGYKVYDKDGYTAKVVLGAGDESEYAVSTGKTGFNVVNVGFSVSKDRYTGSYTYNPDTRQGNFVLMASF